MDPILFLEAAAAAAITAAVVLLLCAWPWRSPRPARTSVGAVLGVALGFYLGCWFLGVRIQCARCHNHPFDRWTRADYYRFAAFFGRLKTKSGGERGDTAVFIADEGEVKHPKTGDSFRPAYDQRRPIRRRKVLLHEIAAYVSAYEVGDDLIDNLEALLMRAFPNELTNARMEMIQYDET